MVDEIERLGAELEAGLFGNHELFKEADVQILRSPGRTRNFAHSPCAKVPAAGAVKMGVPSGFLVANHWLLEDVEAANCFNSVGFPLMFQNCIFFRLLLLLSRFATSPTPA